MIREFLQHLPFHKKPTWAERNFIIILVGSSLIFMAMSLAIGLQQSVWFDEAYSIMLAKQPVDQLIHLTSVDTHPPLYYLLLKAWAGLFGWSEFALRSLSVLAAGGAVVFAGLLARRILGAKAALIALPFVVLAPFLMRYGFEIRMYALASLIGIAATYVLVRAVEAKDSRRQWQLYAVYAVLVAVGVYALYYTVVLWLAHLVWLMWLARHQKQAVFRQRWWLAFAGSILLFVPWLPTFVAQMGNGALAPISQALTVENLTGIVSFMFVYQPTWQLSALLSLVVVFVIAAVTYFIVKAFKLVSSKQKPYLILLALYVAVPVALIALISLVRPMYVERYLAHVLIGASMLIGVSVALVLQKARRSVWSMAGALLVVMTVGVVQLAQVGNYNFQRLQTPAVKQAASVVGDCSEDKTILAADPYVAIELAYYLPNCDIHFYNEWSSLRGGYAPLNNSPLQVKNPADELAGSREIVYIYYDKPALTMPSSLRQTSDQGFGPLHVALFSAE